MSSIAAAYCCYGTDGEKASKCTSLVCVFVCVRACVFVCLQDDIRSVTKEGRNLLCNLETAKSAQKSGAEDRDVKQDRDTVQRWSQWKH